MLAKPFFGVSSRISPVGHRQFKPLSVLCVFVVCFGAIERFELQRKSLPFVGVSAQLQVHSLVTSQKKGLHLLVQKFMASLRGMAQKKTADSRSHSVMRKSYTRGSDFHPSQKKFLDMNSSTQWVFGFIMSNFQHFTYET